MAEPMTSPEPAALEVAAYLRVEAEPDGLRCEIMAGSPAQEHIFYDDTHDVLVMAEYPSMTHYTFVAPHEDQPPRTKRSAKHEQQALARLAAWIAPVLREMVGGERAAVLSMPRTPGSRALHWLVAPLRDGAQTAFSTQVLGMEQAILMLTDGAVDALAGHLRRALI